jgi:hypothetical protein
LAFEGFATTHIVSQGVSLIIRSKFVNTLCGYTSHVHSYIVKDVRLESWYSPSIAKQITEQFSSSARKVLHLAFIPMSFLERLANLLGLSKSSPAVSPGAALAATVTAVSWLDLETERGLTM